MPPLPMSPQAGIIMPSIPPFDYIALITENSTQLELIRTIEDLSHTFAIVEQGLLEILEPLSNDIIEEEQEDGIADISIT